MIPRSIVPTTLPCSRGINKKILKLILSYKSAYSRSAQSAHIHVMLSLISYTLLNYSHLQRQAEFMNGKALNRYTSMLTERYRLRTKVRGRESSDDDDIIATMVMVFADSESETCQIPELFNDL